MVLGISLGGLAERLPVFVSIGAVSLYVLAFFLDARRLAKLGRNVIKRK
jgi:hypothetical protein